MPHSIAAIENWFSQHQDGDFAYYDRPTPYSLIGPVRNGGQFIFVTKPSTIISAFGEAAKAPDFGIIGRYGLPSGDDVDWLCRIVGENELLFLGDLDTPDLLIFAWLRAQLSRHSIKYVGISDAYLDERQIAVPESYIMQMSSSEKKAAPLLRKVFPDVTEIVGAHCASLLKKGCKIELEAIVSAKGNSSYLMPLTAVKDKKTNRAKRK